jgi:DNA-binding transcriptional regulator YiaG
MPGWKGMRAGNRKALTCRCRRWHSIAIGNTFTAQQLKQLRAALGFSQVELAERLGVTWNTVARWETEQRRIPVMAMRLLEFIARDAGVRMPAKGK